MSTIAPDEVVIVDEAWASSGLHLACCVRDQFFCGAQFHPEAEATEAHDENDACPRCVDIRYEHLCPPARPTHQHCPFEPEHRCP